MVQRCIDRFLALTWKKKKNAQILRRTKYLRGLISADKIREAGGN